MITDIRSLMRYFSAIREHQGQPLVEDSAGNFRARKSILVKAIIRALNGGQKVVERQLEDGRYTREFEVRDQAAIERIARNANSATFLASMVGTGVSNLMSKVTTDKYRYITMPAVQAMKNSIGGDPTYGSLMSDYFGVVSSQRQEFADRGAQTGETIGYWLGQLAGTVVGAGVTVGGTAATGGVGAAAAAGAGLAVRAAIAESVGRFGSWLGKRFGREAGEKRAKNYIDTIGRMTLGKNFTNVVPKLGEIHDSSKYALLQNGMYKDGNIVGAMATLSSGKFSTGMQLSEMGINFEKMGGLVEKHGSLSRSDGQIGRKVNFTETMNSQFGIDSTHQYYNLYNSSRSLGVPTKAIRETENAFLKLAMSVSGDGKISTAGIKLSSILSDFMVDYRATNLAGTDKDLSNVVGAVNKLVISSGMGGVGTEGSMASVQKSTNVMDIINTIGINTVDSQFSRQVALRGGVSFEKAARGALGDESTFSGLSTGLLETFNLQDVTLKNGVLDYSSKQGRANYEHAYMTLTAPNEKLGGNLSGEAANSLIQFLVAYKNGSLDYKTVAALPQDARNQISGQYRATQSTDFMHLLINQTKMANSVLKISTNFLNQYSQISSMVIKKFRVDVGLLGDVMGKAFKVMNDIMHDKLGSEFDTLSSAPMSTDATWNQPYVTPTTGGRTGTGALTVGNTGGYTSRTIDMNNAGVKLILARKLVSLSDLKALEKFAAQYNADPMWFLAVFAAESSLDGTKVSSSGHTGFSQLSPDFMRKHGITSEQLRRMNLEQQLKYIGMYYEWSNRKVVKDGMSSLAEIYLLTAAPAFAHYAGGADTPVYVNGRSGFENSVFAKNPHWDLNKDGKITTKELGEYVSGRDFSKMFLTGAPVVRTIGPVAPNRGASGLTLGSGVRTGATGNVKLIGAGGATISRSAAKVLHMSSITSNVGNNAYLAMVRARDTGVLGEYSNRNSANQYAAVRNGVYWYGLCAAAARRAYVRAGFHNAKFGSADTQRELWKQSGYAMTHEEVMAMGGYQIGDLLYDKNDVHVAMVAEGGVLIQAGFWFDPSRNSALINTDISVFGNTSSYLVVRPSMDMNADGKLSSDEKVRYREQLARALTAQKASPTKPKTSAGSAQEAYTKKKFKISSSFQGILKSSKNDTDLFITDKNGTFITDMNKLKSMEDSLEQSLGLKDNQVNLQGKMVGGQKVYFFDIEVDGENISSVTQRVVKALGGFR